MSTPQISVLMSVLNGMPYVSDAITSIRNQTFREYEFIIVNNASTDGTAALLEQEAAADPRVRLFHNDTNLGHSGALNRGLQECRGRWVARMDADDIALPDRFARQLAFLDAEPGVLVASCLAIYIDEQGKEVGKTAHDLTTREAFARYQSSNLAIGILHPGAMMDRSLLCSVGGYRGAYDPANDIDLWGRMADAGAIILVQPEYLMKYRVHSGSTTAQDFARIRLKYQWARDCMRARRANRTEPSWEAYVEERRNAPVWIRLNRWRKTNARRLYRQSAQHLISRRAALAAAEFGGAVLLQPLYAIPRILGQRLK
jgi:glycosyltransferase involved in cell wall biosynthesis